MNHDLELINTAIRLGDVVIPPVGTIVLCVEGGRKCEVRVRMHVTVNGETHLVVGVYGAYSDFVIPPGDIVEIVRIRWDEIPFEQWKRSVRE